LHPILFRFPGFILYTQTVLFVLAFMGGLLITLRTAQHAGIAQFDIINVVLIGFFSSVVGARAGFLLLTWGTAHFTLRELCMLGRHDGGFSFHGGLLGGGLAIWFAARHYRLPVWRLGDVVAPGLAVAMFFMRIGCFLNGCDYGIPTTCPWGIPLHGAPRHPIQLYEAFGNLFLLPLLFALNRRSKTSSGNTLLWYLLLSGLIRVGVDIFRDDPHRYWHFTIPQMLALGIAAIAGGLLWQRTRRQILSEK
jgi:phosphatidylglycerol:prolipoprotein diacylglycerol transferase